MMKFDFSNVVDAISELEASQKKHDALRKRVQGLFVNALVKKYDSLRKASAAVGKAAANMCAIRSGRRLISTTEMLQLLEEVGYQDD